MALNSAEQSLYKQTQEDQTVLSKSESYSHCSLYSRDLEQSYIQILFIILQPTFLKSYYTSDKIVDKIFFDNLVAMFSLHKIFCEQLPKGYLKR